MAFQQWKNIHFLKTGLPTYETMEPKDPVLAYSDMLYFNLMPDFNNSNLNYKVNQTLYPEVHVDKCAALLLYNLADPEWITVDCDEPLGHQAFCVISVRDKTKNVTLVSEKNLKLYDRQCIIRNFTCFVFNWVTYADIFKGNILHTSYANIQAFKFLFDAISVLFPPIFIENAQWFETYERFSNTYRYQKSLVTKDSIEAFIIQKHIELEWFMGSNLFRCASHSYISIHYICDRRIDCPGKQPTDEIGCHCHTSENYSSKCKYIVGNNNKTTCSDFYVKGFNKSCQILSIRDNSVNKIENNMTDIAIEMNNCTITNLHLSYLQNHFTPILINGKRHPCYEEDFKHLNQTTELFKCSSGKTIGAYLINDLIADCGPTAEDEFIIRYNTKIKEFACPKKGQLPCIDGHIRCYNVSQICYYKLSENNNLLPCRTGNHLENCKDFECNAKYKCPEYYCIPWSYVCDGKWDCPYGNDEMKSYCTKDTICFNRYRCYLSQKCVHLMDVCDKENDCPYGDDEFLCSLMNTKCIENCLCLGLTLRCFNISKQTGNIYRHFPFISLHIKYSFESFVKAILFQVKSISILNLNKNNLTKICNILPSLANSLMVDFSYNSIQYITSYCFNDAIYLRQILLNSNNLRNVFRRAFHNLPSLKLLNLTCNSLDLITFDFVQIHLIVFDIRKNAFSQFSANTFLEFRIQHLLTDHYYHCCALYGASICISGKPWYISCESIISKYHVKIFIYIICSSILLLNIMCILLQYLTSKSKTFGFDKIITAISFTDVSYGVYLLFLIVGEGFLDFFMWTSSPLCIIAYGLFFNYNLFSPLVLNLSTLCRLMVTKYPLESRFKKSEFLIKLIIILFTISASITILLYIKMFYGSFTVSSPFCIPLIDPSKQNLQEKIVLWFLFPFQILSLVSIYAMYIFLFIEVSNSKQKVQKQSSKGMSIKSIMLQVVVTVIANTLTWIPSGVIYIVAMIMTEYPMEMIIWTLIAVAPINSVVNPIIYIKTARKK